MSFSCPYTLPGEFRSNISDLNDATVSNPAHLEATAQNKDFCLFEMFVFLKLNMLDFCFCNVVVRQFDYCLYLRAKSKC
jgi:hypothetical protein